MENAVQHPDTEPSRSQQAAGSEFADADVQRRAAALVSKAERASHAGTKLGKKDLQPATESYIAASTKEALELMKAVHTLAQRQPPSVACEADARTLVAALAMLRPDQENERNVLEAALRGVQQFSYKGLCPQAVLLISNPLCEWECLSTNAIAADSEFQQYLTLLKRAFQLFLASTTQRQAAADLRRAAEQLPSLEDVQLRQELLGPVAGTAPPATASKPLPPSKPKQLQLDRIWAYLLVHVLRPAGQLQPAYMGRAHAKGAPPKCELQPLPTYPCFQVQHYMLQVWRAPLAIMATRQAARWRQAPPSATPPLS